MKLSDKITNEDDFNRVCVENNLSMPLVTCATHHFQGPVPWWAQREQLRLKKQYEVTETLTQINKLEPVFAHISEQDKKLVAYTASASDGQADRQIRTTLGRLLTKFFPLWSESHIQKLVSQHAAEAWAEVEFVSGDDIAATYRTLTPGVGACMTFNPGSSTLKDWGDFDPMLAYSMPNIRMALLRDDTGKIIARSMVFEPSDTDKRWIRCYGSKALVNKLERMGYVCGNWAGAEFKAIVKRRLGDRISYAMPYLDSDGGLASESSKVYSIDGRVMCPTVDQRRVWSENVYGTAPGSGGSVDLTDYKSSDFNITCLITGITFSKLLEKAVTYRGFDGNMFTAHSSAADHLTTASMQGSTWLVRKTDTITIGERVYVNTEANLKRYSIGKLDEELYPGVGWSRDAVTTVGGKCVKVEDACRVYDKAGESVWELKNLVDVKKTTYIKLYDKTWATPDSPVVKTETGRKVHTKAHAVGQTIDGDWVFTRGYRETHIGDRTFFYKSTDHGKFNKALDDALAECVSVSEAAALCRTSLRGVNNFHGYLYVDDLYRGTSDRYSRLELETLSAIADSTSRNGRIAQSLAKWAKYRLAEAEALDVDNQHTNQIERVVSDLAAVSLPVVELTLTETI